MDLIATCARHLEPDAAAELRSLLASSGDARASAAPSGISGIITAETSLGADAAIAALRRVLADDPWELRYLLRVIPVHETVRTRVDEIAGAAGRLAAAIPAGETYRITVEKRNSAVSGSEIIAATAARIDRRVCLDAPDWIVLVEILGAAAGIAVVRRGGVMRVAAEKRAGSGHDGGALDEDVL